jgi:hypothetical protein
MWSVYLLPTPGRTPVKIEALRLLIREKLEDGRLPHERISRVQSRPADGEKCDVCERRIAMAQFVVMGTILAGRGSIQLHVQCFQLWDAERLRAIASPQGSTFAADIVRVG